MARLLITSNDVYYSIDKEIPLNGGHDTFYLTNQPDQPVCNNVHAPSFTYGYIQRHHDDFVLYICEAIWINGNKSSLAMHLLRDGDQLTFNSNCHMIFRQN